MFDLTREQQMIFSSLQDIARKEFADNAFEWGRETPWENVEVLADNGFLGLNFDETYGGGGMTEFEAMICVEIVGRVCPETAEFMFTQQMVAPRAIELFGSDQAKQKYLPPVIDGTDSICIAISEPNAGSDVKSMRTTVSDDLILNGEKIWVSYVPSASAAVVWVKFPEGLGSVVVDFEWDGVSVPQHYTNMHGGTQSQIRFEDVQLPEENVLTRGREGFAKQLKVLNWERLGNATLANAVAGNALSRALDYSLQREQFGRPIADFQGIEWKLADMAKELEASRSLTYRSAINANNQGRQPDRLETCLANLYSAEIAERIVSEALQIHGANGYQQGHPLEFMYRMVRGMRLGAGTDEIQKNQIASVLKEHGIPDIV